MKKLLIATALAMASANSYGIFYDNHWNIQMNGCQDKDIPKCTELRLTSNLRYEAGNSIEAIEEFFNQVNIQAKGNISSFELSFVSKSGKGIIPIIVDKDPKNEKIFIANAAQATQWLLKNVRHNHPFTGNLVMKYEPNQEFGFKFEMDEQTVIHLNEDRFVKN